MCVVAQRSEVQGVTWKPPPQCPADLGQISSFGRIALFRLVTTMVAVFAPPKTPQIAVCAFDHVKNRLRPCKDIAVSRPIQFTHFGQTHLPHSTMVLGTSCV